jgi:hypothetical protein
LYVVPALLEGLLGRHPHPVVDLSGHRHAAALDRLE